MNFIMNLIRKFKPNKLPKLLGRWKLEGSDDKTNIKIDWSNEDHCGPCGKFVKSKNDITNKKTENLFIKK